MTVPRDITDPVRGLGQSRRALGDGTLGGRVRSATPHLPRPIGGDQIVTTPAAGPAVLIDTLSLTANSQSIASGGDYIAWANELVGLTPREGFPGYGTPPTETITVPSDGRLLISLWASWASYTGGGQVDVYVTRGAQTLTRTIPGPTASGQHIPGQPPHISVKAGDVIRVRITQSSGSAQTLSSAALDLTLLRKSVRTVGRSYYETVLASGPVAYWRLGEQSGVTAVDAVGSHDGTYTNGPVLGVPGALQDGDPNTAVSFDGVDDSVEGSDWADLEFTGTAAMSVEFWINPDNTLAATYPLIHKQDYRTAGDNDGWVLAIVGNGSALQPRWERWDGTAGMLAWGTYNITAGAWHHIVGTYDGATARVFVNGQQTGEDSAPAVSMPATSAALQMMKRTLSGDETPGDADEVAIYSRELPPAEVLDHYTVGIGAAA